MKSSPAVINSRVSDVFRLLLSGNDRRTIIRYAEARGWGVTEWQVDKYIARASKELTEYNRRSRDELYAASMHRLDDLYAKAYAAADYRTCLAVQRESNDISGLHKETVEHTVTLTDMDLLRKQIDAAIYANPDARDAIIAALKPDDGVEE